MREGGEDTALSLCQRLDGTDVGERAVFFGVAVWRTGGVLHRGGDGRHGRLRGRVRFSGPYGLVQTGWDLLLEVMGENLDGSEPSDQQHLGEAHVRVAPAA